MTVEIKLDGTAEEIAALAKSLQEPQPIQVVDLPNYIPASSGSE